MHLWTFAGLNEQSIPQQVNYFKAWLASANILYLERMQREAEEERRSRQLQLDRELAEERKRQRVLSAINR